MWGKPRTRAELVERARAAFTRRGVRWQMGLIVSATAGIGMLASFVLLTLGLHVIWLRYVLATAAAYAGFLGLVRWWLALSGAMGRSTSSPETGDSTGDSSEALDAALWTADALTDGQIPVPNTGGIDLGGFDLDLGLDEDSLPVILALIVLALAVLAGLLAAGFLVYSAPVFFAEVFVDAALSYGLYRRLSGSESQHWLQSAVARSWIPFLVVGVVFGLAGAVMHALVPEAVSIGDLWRSAG
jgi:hypothetical protein